MTLVVLAFGAGVFSVDWVLRKILFRKPATA
jgi:hypothetical protein